MKLSPKTFRFILWFLIMLWMTWIFTLSAQNSTKSDSLSGTTIRITAQTVDPEFKQLPQKEQDKIIVNWQNIARKSAHVLLYFVLGILSMVLLLQYPLNMNRRFWLALFIAVIYAGSDELHQLFVSGRGCRLTDVGIDTAGAMLGILLVIKLSRIWSNTVK